MGCSSRLIVLYILLAVTSSTPVAPRDGSVADVVEKGMDSMNSMESMDDALAQAAPRQALPGHHGPNDQDSTATESPSATATPDDVGILNDSSPDEPVLEERQSFPTALPALFCPNPPLTVRITVLETATLTLNVATLLPSVATLLSNVATLFPGLPTLPVPPTLPTIPTRLPRQLVNGPASGGSSSADAPPIPTAELLAEYQQQQQQDDSWEMAMGLDPEIPEDEDIPMAKRQLSPMEPTPPAPPILATTVTSSSTFSSDDYYTPLITSATSYTSSTSDLGGGACTTTLTGPMSNPCKGAAHMTYYSSTVTSYSSIDCGPCTDVRVVPHVWGCPMMTAKPAKTATDPYTWTSTVCAASSSSTTSTTTTGLAVGGTESGLQSSSSSAPMTSTSQYFLMSPPAPAQQQTSAELSATSTTPSAVSSTTGLFGSVASPVDL